MEWTDKSLPWNRCFAKEEIVAWETEHRELLKQIAPEEFDVLHYAAIAELKKK